MTKYIINLYSITGKPLGIQRYEHKTDAMQAVAHYVTLGYRVEIHKRNIDN